MKVFFGLLGGALVLVVALTAVLYWSLVSYWESQQAGQEKIAIQAVEQVMAQQEVQRELAVTLAGDGEVRLRGVAVPPSRLPGALREWERSTTYPRVRIQADPGVQNMKLIQLVEACQAAGLNDVTVTQSPVGFADPEGGGGS